MSRKLLCHFLFSILLGTWLTVAQAAPDPAVVELLRQGGKLVLVRHAATVAGFGDPPGFRLDDCGTQRNLSEQGRIASRRFGEQLREHDIPIAQVRSSAWCRCLDTATEAFGDAASVEAWAPLNSFFAGQGDRNAQTQAALAGLAALPDDEVWVWVTHQVNITALTGVSPAMGEALVVALRDGKPEVLARWRP